MDLFKKIIKFLRLLQKTRWIKGLVKGIAANIELENLIKNLKFNTVLDVGSNKGQFILLLEGLFDKKKLIYSFEPIKEVLAKQRKFFFNRKNIFFYNMGLGSKKSKNKNFYITNRKDSSSFLKVNSNLYKSNDFKILSKRKVDLSTIDNEMNNKKILMPILMKIDVQGYEMEVLRGSNKFLKKIKYIVIEVSNKEIYLTQSISHDLIKFMKKNRFKIVKKSSSNYLYNTNTYQKDILFKNQDFK